MRTLFCNEITNGVSYTDMINKAIGSSYVGIQRCWVDLDKFGADGVVAWFVFMDGSRHGYPNEWIWENKLSTFGDEIIEHNVKAPPNETLRRHQSSYGFHPYRLAFQLDPNAVGDNAKCRFVGVFALKKFLNPSLTTMQYVRVMKDFKLGDKGTFGGNINDKCDIYSKMPIYKASVDEMGFSSGMLRMLHSGNVNTVGELLELQLDSSHMLEEIRQKLYEFLKDK